MAKVTPAVRAESPKAGTDAGTESSLSQRIEAAHADVTRLIDVSLRGTPAAAAPGPSQRRASDPTIAVVSAHLAVMQATVYPTMERYLKDRRARARVRALRRSAREAISITRGIEQLAYGDQHRPSEPLPVLQAQLSELMAAHAEDEDALVAELEERMPPDERRKLRKAVEQAARHAPTRPHPHLLFRTRLGARLVVPLAGRWDHLLDTMDARTGGGTPVAPPRPSGLWGWYLLGRPVPPTPATGSQDINTRAVGTEATASRVDRNPAARGGDAPSTTRPPTSR